MYLVYINIIILEATPDMGRIISAEGIDSRAEEGEGGIIDDNGAEDMID